MIWWCVFLEEQEILFYVEILLIAVSSDGSFKEEIGAEFCDLGVCFSL
jgi:hypothetical protein